MIKLCSFLLFVILLSSCVFEQGASQASSVSVIVAPYGSGDRVISQNPIVFLSGGENFTCRPKSPEEDEIREYIAEYNLTDAVYKEIFGIEKRADASNTNNANNARASASSEPEVVSVGEGWLKLGLFIANASTHFLIIEDIVFTGSATHKRQRYHYSENIGSGYCGTSFLYIVPPGSKLEYRPVSKNPFHNLTIYIDGFEVIKNYERDESQSTGLNSFQNNLQTPNQNPSNNQIGQTADSLGTNTGASTGILNSNEELIVIPNYDMKMTLIGHFVTHDGERVRTFVKRVNFRTQSSLQYQ